MSTASPPAEQIVSPADHVETEWQFDAVDLRPVEHWLLNGHGGLSLTAVLQATKHQRDCYLDTDDWRFYRAGFSLRLRVTASGAEATLKSLEGAVGDVRRRREITEALNSGELSELLESSGPVGERVRLVAGAHAVGPIFEIQTYRRTFSVQLHDQPPAEVALDETSVPVGETVDPVRLQRVEIEVADAASSELQAFVQALRADCSLQPAAMSKFELGLFARGLKPPGLPEFGSRSIAASQSIGEVAYAILRRQFAAFLAHEPGTRLGEDPEELHDMRVAARRMRAAMRLFDDALPARAEKHRAEVSWIARALGEVRDLDVQLEQIHAWSAGADGADREALQVLASMMAARRSASRRQLLRALDSRRYERLVASAGALLRRGPSRQALASAGASAQVPVVVIAPGLISRRYRKVRKLGSHIRPDSPPEDFHRLRIECKRLRYALEFFVEIYGKPAQALIQRLVVLQDLLGQHQDAYVAISHLQELSLAHTKRLAPATVFAMGRIAERYAQQAASLRADFSAAFEQLKGKPWKRLRRVMESRREVPLAAARARRRPPKPKAPPVPDPAVPISNL
jgi:CHAD domain-containing protein